MAYFGKIILVLLVYLCEFLAFGSFVTVGKREEISFTKALLYGFFSYYVLFQIVTIPFMFMQKSLSLLSYIWLTIMGLLFVWATIRYGRLWIVTAVARIKGLFGKDRLNWIPILVLVSQVILASAIYVSFWDATYYVGQVSFSVYTNTINQIDPLSGEFLQYFDLKHCLATYHVNDAVFCQIFRVPALVETKTIMVIVISALTSVLYYCVGKLMFHEKKEAIAIFMVLTFVVNCCTYSSYTTSNFLIFRTYEGKTITGNISILMIIYLLLQLYREGESQEIWFQLFLVSWGAVAVASSAMFLVPATLAAGLLPYSVIRKKPTAVIKMIITMLPCILVIFCYMLGRMGWLEIAVRIP